MNAWAHPTHHAKRQLDRCTHNNNNNNYYYYYYYYYLLLSLLSHIARMVLYHRFTYYLRCTAVVIGGAG